MTDVASDRSPPPDHAAITVYMLKFSKTYPDRVTHRQNAPSLT